MQRQRRSTSSRGGKARRGGRVGAARASSAARTARSTPPPASDSVFEDMADDLSSSESAEDVEDRYELVLASSSADSDAEHDNESDDEEDDDAEDAMDAPTAPTELSPAVQAFYISDLGHYITTKIIREDPEMRAVLEAMVDTLTANATPVSSVALYGALYQTVTSIMEQLLVSAQARAASAENIRAEASARSRSSSDISTKDIAKAATRRHDPEAKALVEGNRQLARLAAALTLMHALLDSSVVTIPEPVVRQTVSAMCTNVISVLLRDTAGAVAVKIATPTLKISEKYLAVVLEGPPNVAMWKKARAKDGHAWGQELASAVLTQCITGKPAARKIAFQVVSHLLGKDSAGHFSAAVSKFLVVMFASPATTTTALKKLMCALRLCRDCMPLLSNTNQDSVLQALIKLHATASSSSVSAAIFSVLSSFALKQQGVQASSRILELLLERRPTTGAKDLAALSSWLSAVTGCMIALLHIDATSATQHLANLLSGILVCMQSESRATVQCAAASAQRLASAFLGGNRKDLSLMRFLRLSADVSSIEDVLYVRQSELFLEACNVGPQHAIFALVDAFIDFLLKGLKFAYQNAWDAVCKVVQSTMTAVSRNISLFLHQLPVGPSSSQSSDALFAFMTQKLSGLLPQLLSVRESLRERMQKQEEAKHRGRNTGRKPTMDSMQKTGADASVASVARVIGLQNFLNLVGVVFPTIPRTEQPFPGTTKSQATEANLWVLPFCKHYGLEGCGSLGFFMHVLMPTSRRLLGAASQATSADNTISRKLQTLSEQIWALFPAIARGATDVPESFSALAQALGPLLNDPSSSWEVKHAVIQGLTGIIQHIRSSMHSQPLKPSQQNRIQASVTAISHLAAEFLQTLFSVYMSPPAESSAEDSVNRVRNVVFSSIEAFLFMASQNTTSNAVASLFKRIMAKLLSGDTRTPLAVAAALIDLSLAFVPFLDEKTLSLLYRALEPYLLNKVAEARSSGLESNAFKVLVQLCSTRGDDFLASHLQSVLKLMLSHLASLSSESTLTPSQLAVLCAVATRLDASELLQWMQGASPFSPSPLPAVLMGLRDSKARSRDASKNFIIKVGERMVSANGSTGARTLVSLLAVGLAGRSSHFQAATLASLALVVHGFENQLIEAENISLNSAPESGALLQLVRTAQMLLEWHTADVRQAAARLLVCLVKPTFFASSASPPVRHIYSNAWGLAVSSCLRAPDAVRMKLRSDFKVIIERIIKKWGWDVVDANCPQSQRKFATNIRKSITRARRAKQARTTRASKSKSEEKVSKKGKKTSKGAFETTNDSDSSSGSESEPDEFFDEPKRRARKSASIVTFEDTDDPMDFTSPLDPSAGKPRRTATAPVPVKLDGDGDIKMADDGRLVIGSLDGSEDNALDDAPVRPKRKRGDDSDDSDDDEKVHRNRKSSDALSLGKRTKVAEPDQFGSDYYKAKKGRSDVKRKGSKFEPFAYLPLNPKFLNKRRRLHAHKQYNQVAGSGGHRPRNSK